MNDATPMAASRTSRTTPGLCFCTASTGTIARATSRSKFSRAPSLRSGPGQSVALVAPSGAGKSTLLHIAGLLEQPDARRGLCRPGRDLAPVGRRAHPHPPHRDRLRLPVPSPADGVLRDRERDHAADDPRPVARRGQPARDRPARTISASRSASRIGRRSSPAASSSGSRSRARSPMRRASCWPTSRPETSIRAPSEHVFSALTQLVRASGLAVVVATHNMDIAGRMDRRVTLREGLVVELE